MWGSVAGWHFYVWDHCGPSKNYPHDGIPLVKRKVQHMERHRKDLFETGALVGWQKNSMEWYEQLSVRDCRDLMELAQADSCLCHAALAGKFCVWAMGPTCPGMTPLQPGSTAPVPSRAVGFYFIRWETPSGDSTWPLKWPALRGQIPSHLHLIYLIWRAQAAMQLVLIF